MQEQDMIPRKRPPTPVRAKSVEVQATPLGAASALNATLSTLESENQRMLEEIKLQRAILVNNKLKKKMKNLKVDDISMSELRKDKELNKKGKESRKCISW